MKVKLQVGDFINTKDLFGFNTGKSNKNYFGVITSDNCRYEHFPKICFKQVYPSLKKLEVDEFVIKLFPTCEICNNFCLYIPNNRGRIIIEDLLVLYKEVPKAIKVLYG